MAKTLLKSSAGTLIKEYLLITLGLTLYALGWALFLTPNSMLGGGVTGFSSHAANDNAAASIKNLRMFFIVNYSLLIILQEVCCYRFFCRV